MVRFELSIVVNKPLEEVFRFVSNPDNEAIWQTHVQEAKATSGDRLAAGAKFSQVAHFLGRSIKTEGEITEYEENRGWSWQSTSGPVSGKGQNIFKEVDENQTEYTSVAEMDVGGFFKIAEPLFARSARRQIEANFANLKDILEAVETGS